jgi:mono/diheme cytochrome c family protein
MRSASIQLTCSALLLLVSSACDAPKAPLRTWTPEDHGQPQADDSRQPMQEAVPEQGGVERAAAALFNVSCASCHGREGHGDGPARPPAAQIPDFASAEFQKARTDEQLAQVIREGKNMMPPFGKQVNPQGITALIAHVRLLGPVVAAPVPVAPSAP